MCIIYTVGTHLRELRNRYGHWTIVCRQGKVRYIACSNFEAWRVCEALWTSEKVRTGGVRMCATAL